MSRSNQLAGLLTADPPSALDTINEINTALGNDASLSTTLTNSIATKAPLASPTFTGDAVFDTDTLKVDATNNKVGIGTSSPSSYYYDKLTIDHTNSNSGITLKAGTTEISGIAFADGTTGNEQYRGRILYYHNEDRLSLGSAGDTHLHINSSGNVGIGTAPSSIFHVDEGSGTSGFLFDSGLRRLKIVGSNSDGGYVSLEATDHDGSNASSRNLILEPNGGKVGIGITSPTGGLHLYDDRDITNNPNDKGLRLDESSGKWLLSLGQSGTSNTSFGIRDVTNSKYPIIIQSQTNAGSTPAINIYNDGRVDFDKAIFAEALRTLFLGRNTTLTINPYTQLGQYGQGGCFYVSFATWAGRAGLFQVRWNNGGGNGGIVASTYDPIVNGGGGLGLTVTHTQNNSIYDSTISITSSGHHTNSHGWAGGVINFARYDS